MAFRSVRFSKPTDLSVRYDQLHIKQGEKELSVPLEDIATITLEDPAIRLSSHVLQKAAEHGIVIIGCDQTRMPSGIYQSYYTHSRQLSVLQMQLQMSKPFRKRCWQSVVQNKIMNQAKCCDLAGLDSTASELRQIADSVGSGNPTNREAYAARIYFMALFSKTFRRRTSSDWRNAALNYGYAILRSGVARSISQYGFIPALGIHHCNELNAFNLVDDLFEPFRPIADYQVYLISEQSDFQFDHGLTSEMKNTLTRLLHVSIRLNGEECSVLHAIDLMVKSFVTAGRANQTELLRLPELLDLKPHSYE